MLDNLTKRFSKIIKKIKGEARLTETNTSDMLREIRIALLEADVSFVVVKDFIDSIKKKCLGVEVVDSLNPGQVLVSIVHKELVRAIGGDFGEYSTEISLDSKPPAIILMVGLQGVGKTTTAGKLAYWFKNGHHVRNGKLTGKKKVLLVSTDIYRPAAIEQLNIIANQIEVDFFDVKTSLKPCDIAIEALDYSRRHYYDIVIFDTAGRLGIDDFMMNEIKSLHKIVSPIETLFIVDSMQGQDAINTAKAFSEVVPITGIILTKLDGDSRGGVALSVSKVTGRPLKLVGVSEKINGLELFHPDRMASRILGMGDILSLVEQAQKNIDFNDNNRTINLLKSKDKFDFNDFYEQISQMKKIGSMSDLLDKLPEGLQIPSRALGSNNPDKMIIKTEAIINSMTLLERSKPDIIKSSRKRRISKGSGTTVQDVNNLIKQLDQMQSIVKKIKKNGFGKIFRSITGVNNFFK
ncbi:signal recognition particle protein [Candidatus Kinetoplastidibacterium crithidiae]|uniref:Signal recognition particle protein n=1 Tax=Candidatus Kinetoplastidibacterium crithidiae TCC036E TaxID=1208918 RepID=M1LNW8_9PROT|nr:signal recognition particle protein [Candidatus Kinetoplastibacterium crithidii]AFZ83105.1 signal recognition particle subunit SRP54 [Candidatus Kinetoplastibacterium crithidii (ex Angomonas deanei ATCC 30255)]AGF47382.1 signal recognition particle subunit SRP54 [Candidatus Kinetoplastibacterium crithidii TCC036E]